MEIFSSKRPTLLPHKLEGEHFYEIGPEQSKPPEAKGKSIRWKWEEGFFKKKLISFSFFLSGLAPGGGGRFSFS